MTSNSGNLFVPPKFNNHSPLTWYRAASQKSDFIRDGAQARAIEYLDRLWTELMMFKCKRNRFLGHSLRSPQVPKGLYLYGGVGRGRSSLVDAFYGCLPYRRKRRVYFHAFMAEIHRRSKGLKSETSPLKTVAAEIAEETRVLCLDEFRVSDIADAMISGRLLENLLNEGTVLVAISNYAPSELYPQGQDRSSFLPAIALIEANPTVLNVDGDEGYRLHTLKPAGIFFAPDNDESEQKLSDLSKNMSGGVTTEVGISVIHGREIPHKAKSEQVIWFDSRALCFGPRSQADYLYLAKHYKIVFLSGLERLTPQEKAEARHLTWLIDVLYDYRVKLCATSKVGVDDIYVGGDFAQKFIRTASRMAEMQSEAYLKLPHLTLNAPKSRRFIFSQTAL